MVKNLRGGMLPRGNGGGQLYNGDCECARKGTGYHWRREGIGDVVPWALRTARQGEGCHFGVGRATRRVRRALGRAPITFPEAA
jgi:hypothetical protein